MNVGRGRKRAGLSKLCFVQDEGDRRPALLEILEQLWRGELDVARGRALRFLHERYPWLREEGEDPATPIPPPRRPTIGRCSSPPYSRGHPGVEPEAGSVTSPLERAQRLLLQARLRPVQSDRFVPASFPDLGPAEYLSPKGTTHLLVDSVPSVANRMEAVVWDDERQNYIEPLQGLPFVTVEHPQHGAINSVEEPARLGSPYIYPAIAPTLKHAIEGKANGPRALRQLVHFLFRTDPNCVLHGTFLPKLRAASSVTRLLTGFIDAKDVGVVESAVMWQLSACFAKDDQSLVMLYHLG